MQTKQLPPALPLAPLPEPPATPTAPPQRPRSLRMQYRFLRTLSFAAWLLVRLLFWYYFVERILGRRDYIQDTNIQRWTIYAREYRHFAIAMGGVMIKLGQFVSTRVDILPEEIIMELAGLQDEVPSVPFDKIRPVIERELGPISNRYQWVNETPVAAASLGQVHRAQLLNGDRVVIKVQRPGIDQIVYTDLAALRIVSHVAMWFRFVNRRADTRALAEEFGRVLLEEISYEREAYNAARFARIFRDDMGVYIPHVYHEHSSNRVLTIEDVTTIKITDYAAMEDAGIKREVVASRLMDTYLKQIFEDRFFHADPHPGNLFVYPLPVADENADFGPDGRPFYLIFIDFGMTGTLTEEITEGLIDTLRAVLTRDPHGLIDSYSRLGFILPNADMERIEEATVLAFNRVWGLSMSELRDIDFEEMSALGAEFNDLLYDMPFYVPQDFIYLARAVGILSGMCTSLDPEFNPWQEMQVHSQALIMRGVMGGEVTQTPNGLLPNLPSLTGLTGLTGLLSGSGAQLLTEIVQMVVLRTLAPDSEVKTDQALLARAERGEIKFQVDPGYKLQRQLQRAELQERKTTRVVVAGSFLIAATLLYTSGETALALGGYIIAGATYLNSLINSGE